MDNSIKLIALCMALLPLGGCLIAGLSGHHLSRRVVHSSLVALVGFAFLLSCYLFKLMVLDGYHAVDAHLYTWASAGVFRFDVAFLIDRLSAIMCFVVLFVSLMVHIYTIGYMSDDPGYRRFFSYVSLFTFAMLMLVLADNFLLMFFGWEGVGLVSYLLIGFWFNREAANFGSFKAFLANRVGDVAFILGIAAALEYFGSLNYLNIFQQAHTLADVTVQLWPGYSVSVISLTCILMFIGAMAKSAQMPLHVWLPESMEGPTPISALIHAATMVTAGIYMVARMSPVFEYSEAALTFILVIGGTSALFTGFLAVVQNDIKRVIAYSTLSQLGYMAVALGASAYNAAIFHLITHAFFKALLFLAAGSVILGMHHEQDMRKMGGLAKYMPVTYITFMVGALALCAIPPFSGFFSKDMIIDAVKHSHTPGATYAYFCVLIGAFVTSLYTFRALFMTFHTNERFDAEVKSKIHESEWVVLVPLICLAIPSLVIGGVLIGPMLFAKPNIFGSSIFILPQHDVFTTISAHFHGAVLMSLKAGSSPVFWLAISGIIVAWLFTAQFPHWSEIFKTRFAKLYAVLIKKYGFDDFNQIVLVHGTRDVGDLCYQVSDVKIIDGACVNGSGRLVRWFSQTARRMQSGYLYHYALMMVLGIVLLLAWYVWRA